MSGVVAILVASLLGSPHCAAMCGPLVAVYAGSLPGATGLSHAAYNAGRLASYAALGVIAGSLGLGVDRAGAVAGLSGLAAVVAGTFMVAWGGAQVLALRGVRTGLHAPQMLQRIVGASALRVRGRAPWIRAAIMGMASGLLPCGWLYVFVLAAAAGGSPLLGGVMMAIFWLGTLPVMVALGLSLQRLSGRFRARLPALTAAVVMILGLLTITGRMRPPVHAVALSEPVPQHGHR